MIYETYGYFGADVPAETLKPQTDTSGIWSGIFGTAQELIKAISKAKQDEREADTLAQATEAQERRLALEAQLNSITSGGGMEMNQLYIIGGIAAFALIAILLIKK